jgi:predicted nucleic acid-binding protein
MNLIVDASVAVKWFLDEEGSEAARRLLAEASLDAPDLILIETYNAVWKRWRRREARGAQLDQVIPVLTRALSGLCPVRDLIDAAAALSRQLSHPVYDCLYLALAARDAVPLVTADGQMFEAARRVRIEARLL